MKRVSREFQKEAFDRQASTYELQLFAPTVLAARSRFKKLVSLLPDVDGAQKNCQALELGCGTGLFTAELAQYWPGPIVASDISMQMLNLARNKLRDLYHQTISFEQAPAENLPLADNSCVRVFAFACLHHVADLPAAFKEVYRVLSPGGLLAIMEPNPLHPLNALLGVLRREERGMLHSWPGRWNRLAHNAGLTPLCTTWTGFFPGKPASLVPLFESVEKIMERTPLLRRVAIHCNCVFRKD